MSPSQRRAGICLTACSNAAAGDVVALVHDDQPVAAGELFDVGLAAARSWWRDQHTEVMVAQIVHGVPAARGSAWRRT
ncbi:MAG: hypothetical protein ACRDTZ_12505 [Pseudonocardiaceae bacterium]